MSTEKYPLDFDALEKGTWLEGSVLERAVGCTPRDHGRWNLGLMKLCKMIERAAGIVSYVDHDRIRLCTDAEACNYTTRMNERAQSMMFRSVARRTLIDRENLTEEQRSLADRRDRYLGSVAQATRQEARKQRKMLELLRLPANKGIESRQGNAR